MWPRRALTTPILRPGGVPASPTEPRVAAGTTPGFSSFSRRISTSPSITSANSSCAGARQPEVPSVRMASITYSMFLPTATFSYGLDFEATSKMFEKT